MKRLYLLLFGLLACSACGSKHVFEQYVNLPNYVWSRSNIIVIKADLEQALATANVQVLVRYGTAYPFDALNLQVVNTDPKGKVQKANYTVPLRDASGKNLGSGMGDMWDVAFPIAKGVPMEKGTYTFEISHTMDEEIMPMLVDIGLAIDDATNKK